MSEEHPARGIEAESLRRRIRMAGDMTRYLRQAVLALAITGVAMMAFPPVLWYMSLEPETPAGRSVPLDSILGYWVLGGFGGLLVIVLAPFALAAGYRRLARLRLRRQLAGLSREARAAVLGPLARDPIWDTRKIAAPLLREFGLPSEVTPAAPSFGGEGHEPVSG